MYLLFYPTFNNYVTMIHLLLDHLVEEKADLC